MEALSAKPFLKWAGGKTQLLSTLEACLPGIFRTQSAVTYIEPFVGGGAMLFYMLQKYPQISRAVINDINPRLINVYAVIRNKPEELIDALSAIEADYKGIEEYERQREYFMNARSVFNSRALSDVEEASYMIFLNRTCFNGLYRENSKGEYNVPFGRYHNPTICDKELIMVDSRLLQRVVIMQGDFAQVAEYVDDCTFVYLDPPYRPLDATSNFNSYVKEAFNDDEQIRLKDLFCRLNDAHCYVMESNSDGRSRNPKNLFFDELYKDFNIQRVTAKRFINANPNRRGNMSELLITNY